MYATQHPSERVRIIDRVREQRAISSLRRAHRVQQEQHRAWEQRRRELSAEDDARRAVAFAQQWEERMRKEREQSIIRLSFTQLLRRLFA